MRKVLEIGITIYLYDGGKFWVAKFFGKKKNNLIKDYHSNTARSNVL